MKKLKNWLLTSGLLTMVLTLSGCVKRLENGEPDPNGLIWIWVGYYCCNNYRSLDYFTPWYQSISQVDDSK